MVQAADPLIVIPLQDHVRRNTHTAPTLITHQTDRLLVELNDSAEVALDATKPRVRH